MPVPFRAAREKRRIDAEVAMTSTHELTARLDEALGFLYPS